MRQATALGKSTAYQSNSAGQNVLWGVLAAWAAVLIYAAANPIVVSLVDMGASNLVGGGRNALTYSNLYFLGTLISVVPLAYLFRRDLKPTRVRRLSRKDWRILTLSAFLSSALTPALFFFALSETSVSNVALISRIEPPLFLMGALLVLGERFDTRTMIAALMALTGAIWIIAAQDRGSWAGFGLGEAAAVAGTLSYVASTLVARAGLKRVPLGLFTVYRAVAGAAMYFTGATVIFGPSVFQDLFEPILWQWVWVYAGIVLVMGQLVWAMALKTAKAGTISLAASFAPLAAVLIAMMFLGEDPGPGLMPGAAMILASIAWAHGLFDRNSSVTVTVKRPSPQLSLGQPRPVD
ncbi:MAG: DMT family transporter [Pseudomonadota bacterium]